MKRTSHTAALAASLVFSSIVAAGAADDCVYDDMPFETARTSEERLLGSDDEAARHLAHLPFTREIAAAGVVGETLASSLAEARVPATVMLEARKALAGTLDFEREVGAGDRFYVRYRQPFTVDGTPIGTAQLLWLELRTTAKGTVALHRFQPKGGTEQLWLANGEAAGNAALRLPLDVINVSSGFGLRPDPLDKPGPPMGPLADPGAGSRRSAARAAAASQGGAFAAAAPAEPGRPLRLRRRASYEFALAHPRARLDARREGRDRGGPARDATRATARPPAHRWRARSNHIQQ